MATRKLEETLELIDTVESYMLQGYTAPSQIARLLKNKNVGQMAARSYIEHVRKRWSRNTSKQTRDQKREQVLQMHMHALRQAYNLFAEARTSIGPRSLSEANRALSTIRALLGQIADVEGVRERTMRLGGDRDQIPIQVEEEHRDVFMLEEMLKGGRLDGPTVNDLRTAILGATTRNGEDGSGNLRVVDAQPASLPAPQGDHRSGSTEGME